MLEMFIDLANAVTNAGSITYASLCNSGSIAIDGVTDDGKSFHLIYRVEQEQDHADT